MKQHDTFETVEDLIANPEFKKWVLSPTSNSTLFWEKWMEAHPDKKEMLYDARRFILSISFEERTLSQGDFDDVLQAIIGKKKLKKLSFEKKVGWSGKLLKIAAVISMLVVSFYMAYQSSDSALLEAEVTNNFFHKENPKGQKSRFKLPDGTKVWLNSNSKIHYKEVGETRLVSLSGEAFFDVFRDTSRPFEVHSNDLVTTALGTSFNVLAYEEKNYVEVSLITGKVLIETDQNELLKEVLHPNELVVFDKSENKLHKKIIMDSKLLDWKDGLLYFKDADLEEVITSIEVWFGVEIDLKNKPKKAWKYNGEFKNKDLATVLSRISFVENFDFAIDKNYIEINFRE